jgi:hypothetical protein
MYTLQRVMLLWVLLVFVVLVVGTPLLQAATDYFVYAGGLGTGDGVYLWRCFEWRSSY